MRRLGGAVVAAAACTACTLLVGTSGLSGEDAGVPAAGADARAETSTSVDGAADAPASVTCGDPSFVICETFDTPGSTDRYPRDLDDTTSIDPDDTRSVSPPGSARFTIQASTSNQSPDATLAFKTSIDLSDFAVEGKVFVAKSEPGQNARLLRIVSVGVGEPMMVNRSGDVVHGNAITGGGVVPFDKWVRIRVEIRSSMQPAQATIEIDGVRRSISLQGGWTPGLVTASFGISEANSPTTGWLVNWDDVVIQKL